MYPIAMDVVNQSGVDRKKMAMALMLAASDYMTSFGYQTNLMVYGPGGYSNMDFVKFGGPMQVILWLSTTAMLSASDEVWLVFWFISVLGLVVVVVLRLIGGEIMLRRHRSRRPKRNDDQSKGHRAEDGNNDNVHENVTADRWDVESIHA
jgi:hypothetical protein